MQIQQLLKTINQSKDLSLKAMVSLMLKKIWSKDLKYEVVASPIVDTLVTNASATGALIAISQNSKTKRNRLNF